MTYSEKLRDPRWQKKRLRILERDEWKCCACSATEKNLQVHHLVYYKGNNPWDYSDDTLQTLCNDCHESRQEHADNAANALRLAMKNVPNDKLPFFSGMVIALAMNTDASRQHAIMTLQESTRDSARGVGSLDHNLWSDLVMDVMVIQIVRERSVAERAINLMSKASEILRAKYGILG